MKGVNIPRQTPLDSLTDVVAATSFLRQDDGRLSAERVAKLYGVGVAELAEWLGRPVAESIQDPVSYFEHVARLLGVVPEDDFRRWLRTPNPNLSNESPVAWLKNKRWQQMADFVDHMLTGAPS